MDYIFIPIIHREPTCSLYGLSAFAGCLGITLLNSSKFKEGFTDTVGARTALLPPNAMLPDWEDVLNPARVPL
ncbi:hypothetical protein A3H11_02745 [Candidatus Uhrbacteria bacterium RIFCSPLOWO2_12_FULL_47_10]|nr:MAG: hypothetical protein A3J03_04895 [Candidatus Uhrbacteria bacterium RIFCSPLOWO2_02_FULL_46_25]OGL91827.1 MAG: hypothetical protein A3H11_02745 [Candidatus Uhrbacteria bacterium RIFCSPLOWO2_12_FULL_47_10]